ncbi:MAG: hypothetical protein AABZ06_11680 [Bdellovibrionota bacterium]
MDKRGIIEIIDFLVNKLGGDWFLTGGALVKISFDESRGTEDVDLLRIRHPRLSDEGAKNKLFRWLIDRGLGPEWVNTAVEPFVREVPKWEDETVLIKQGKLGCVFRPNLTLFVYLKLRRASEIDIKDIQTALQCCPEGLDEEKLLHWPNEKVHKNYLKFKSKPKMAR